MSAAPPDESPCLIDQGMPAGESSYTNNTYNIAVPTGKPRFSADTDNASVLVRMFAWWNDAIKDPDGFTEEAFRLYYTEDAAIIINGK